jgi:hypothetical protein
MEKKKYSRQRTCSPHKVTMASLPLHRSEKYQCACVLTLSFCSIAIYTVSHTYHLLNRYVFSWIVSDGIMPLSLVTTLTTSEVGNKKRKFQCTWEAHNTVCNVQERGFRWNLIRWYCVLYVTGVQQMDLCYMCIEGNFQVLAQPPSLLCPG